MDNWMLYPPVTFLVILIFSIFLSFLFSRLSYRGQGKQPQGAGKAYACGEDIKDHLSQPDYSQFFPFAFFFTIGHVATLMMTTVPVETMETMVLAVLYIAAVVVSLVILFRR